MRCEALLPPQSLARHNRSAPRANAATFISMILTATPELVEPTQPASGSAPVMLSPMSSYTAVGGASGKAAPLSGHQDVAKTDSRAIVFKQRQPLNEGWVR